MARSRPTVPPGEVLVVSWVDESGSETIGKSLTGLEDAQQVALTDLRQGHGPEDGTWTLRWRPLGAGQWMGTCPDHTPDYGHYLIELL